MKLKSAFVILLFMMVAMGFPTSLDAKRITAREFDLACDVKGHTYRAHNPELAGHRYAMPQDWEYPVRYAFDLDKGMYADVTYNKRNVVRLVGSTRTKIFVARDDRTTTTIDLAKRRFHQVSKLSEYKNGFAAGPCRYVRFSGLR
jgi:hypothetical protein